MKAIKSSPGCRFQLCSAVECSTALLLRFRLRTKAPHFLVMWAYGLGRVHTSSPSLEMNEVKGMAATVDTVYCFGCSAYPGLFLLEGTMRVRLKRNASPCPQGVKTHVPGFGCCVG